MVKHKRKSLATVRKEKAQRDFLKLVKKGCEFPDAADAICVRYNYSSKSTVYKWLENPEFREKVLIAEGEVLARLRQAEFQSAQGGFITERTKEYFAKGGIRKEIIKRASPNIHAIDKASKRRGARLRRIAARERKEDEIAEIKRYSSGALDQEDVSDTEIPLTSKVIFLVESRKDKDDS